MKHLKITRIYSLLFVIFCGCSPGNDPPDQAAATFAGEPQAVEQAEQMFTAIGGKTAWCDLRSLYIKAEHTEPRMTIPYTSEIWRAIDEFELIIEQQNDSFHVKAVMTPNEGKIRYYDNRDTLRTMTDKQLQDWEFGHRHNVYVILHDLACDPAKYRVALEQENRLSFYQDTTFVTSFGLDEQMRPHLFYQPNSDGSISGSIFTHWGRDNGLVHSAGGHPLDSNFMYQTERWQPSGQSLEEAFGSDIFGL